MSDTGTQTPPPQNDPNTITVPASAFGQGAGDGVPQNNGMVGYTVPSPPQTNPGQPPSGRWFTEEDVERFRRQERDKLYPQLEETRTKLAEFERREQERAEREAQERAQREEAERRAREEDMSAKELIEAQRQEYEARFQQIQQERAQERAIFERERRFQELQAYKARVLAANADNILPEFNDPEDVSGDSEEAINASVQRLVEKSARVMQNFQMAQDEGRRAMPGVPPTAPAIGPQDMFGAQQRTFTPEQIAAMPMSEWAKVREHLGPGQADRGDHGMYR